MDINAHTIRKSTGLFQYFCLKHNKRWDFYSKEDLEDFTKKHKGCPLCQEKKEETKNKKQKKEPTLCWRCENARADRCERFNREGLDKPMDIWTEYEECSVRTGIEAETRSISFLVKKCKNFKEDGKRKSIAEVGVIEKKEVLN